MSDAHRNSSIRSAVLTSVLSKAGTALLQLLALPLAMRVMGWEEFGLYASVAGFLTAMYLFEAGLGPALTHGISQAVARDDQATQSRLSATAFYLIAALMLLGASVLATLILTQPVERLFGAEFTAYADVLKSALWVGLILLSVSLLLSHTDRLREGYLEARYVNLWGAAGNFLAAAAVGIGIWAFPSVIYLLLAVFGPLVLGRLANTWQLWRARPWVTPRPRHFHHNLVRGLITDGVAFAVVSLGVNLVEFNLIQNLFGRVAGPSGVTSFSIFVTLTIAQLGFVMMLTTPTWPAIADAAARGELAWVRRAARRLEGYALAFAFASGTGLVLLGPWLLPLWLGPRAASLDRPILLAYAFYFLLYAWRHVQHMVLIGLGQTRRLARIQLLESVLLALAAWFAMQHASLALLLAVMTTTILLITGWRLPWLVRQELRSLAAKPSTPPPPAVTPSDSGPLSSTAAPVS